MTIQTGTTLTCTNPECPCSLRVVQPCPHGDAFTCGCGHPLEALESASIPPTPGA